MGKKHGISNKNQIYMLEKHNNKIIVVELHSNFFKFIKNIILLDNLF